MAKWIEVGNSTDIPNGGSSAVIADELSVLIVNADNNFYAIENLCTHDGGDLAEGEVEGCAIVCPRHGAKFCLKTGAVTAPPAYEDIKTFPLKIEDYKIFIQLESI